jgi:hypothetical protein
VHRASIRCGRPLASVSIFSIALSNISDPRDVFAIDLRNAPHVFAPGFEVIFRQDRNFEPVPIFIFLNFRFSIEKKQTS